MKTVKERLDAVRPEIIVMVKEMHDHPELGHQEFKAMELQAALLEKYGFTVETGVADVKTAYIAKYKGGRKKARKSAIWQNMMPFLVWDMPADIT